MRLNNKEIKAIVNSFKFLFPDVKYTLYLFGSRVDDSKKGGDIDLLVVTESKDQKDLIIDSKTRIKLKIFESLDEQKIDITVALLNELETDTFLKKIFPEAKALG